MLLCCSVFMYVSTICVCVVFMYALMFCGVSDCSFVFMFVVKLLL